MQSFSPDSRLWIYQANRTFSARELSLLKTQLSDFTRQWTAHDNQLHAGSDVRYDQFIFLYVDETHAGASGCSIDKSVKIMHAIEDEFGVALFDRFSMAYRDENGEIRTVSRAEFEELILQGKIHGDTIVFNNLVQTLKEADSNWEIPFAKSWHPRIFSLPV
ncbi:MAG: ABC transporter ATPase [Mucilaginibacter polytrichastri]|nr:ABC transporter ATPase [Mucilaginibacter polytrichastri]